MDPQLFCLRWNNHQSNLLSVFDQLLQIEAFCDVTLAVDGASLKCHKMVLAACSNYFQSLFMENTCKHPIVFLKDIRFNQIRALLDYMYHGEVSVAEEELPALLKVAEALKVKGLVEPADDDRSSNNSLQTPVKAGKINNLTTSSPSSRSNPSTVTTTPSKLPIWPVSTNKLLSPKAKLQSENTVSSNGNGNLNTNGDNEDPGHLVIDEESYESGNVTAMSPLDVDYDMNYLHDNDTPPAPGMVKTINANGKVEWKRYKQYTKDDILAAIEEVKAGMSALQASRKYGVPSRTLYDKVKKMGILTPNMQKQQQQKKAAEQQKEAVANSNNFPPINLLGLQLPQSSLPNMTNRGEGGIDKAVDQGKNGNNMPPFSGAMMLSMLERMKAVAGAGNKSVSSLPSSLPLNLSSMLDSNSTGGSESTGEGSSDSRRSSEELSEIKQEDKPEVPDIRAEFFAELKRFNDPKDMVNDRTGPPNTTAPSSSVIKPLNELYSSHNGDGTNNTGTHSVTLAPREQDGGDSNLPPRKRKISHETNAECLKKVSVEENSELESNIKIETTSY